MRSFFTVVFVFAITLHTTFTQDSACFESSSIQEILPNDCTLLNTCKFSENVADAIFIYSYHLVNGTGSPSEEYTVRYYFDEIRTECLKISECCVGKPCNDTSNPLIGSTAIGTGLSGPSYSLYACNIRDHSAFLEGQSHFEFNYLSTNGLSSQSISNWWILLILVGTFGIILLAFGIGYGIYKKRKSKINNRSQENEFVTGSLLDDFE